MIAHVAARANISELKAVSRMQRLGGAVIHMQPNSEVLNQVTFLTGSADIATQLPQISAIVPFDENIISFLNDLSRVIMKDPRSRLYSDVTAFGFWIRKGSVLKMKDRFTDDGIRLGRGVAFHVAPSNVPVNFAFSLATGLLCGNANVVRVPSKEFPQVEIIIEALRSVLDIYKNMKSYVLCVRYDRNKEINDYFSSIADIRIVWGGDRTVSELRTSSLPPRSCEITFADRYSIAVIDSDAYLAIEDKIRVAEDFYNDTYFFDQNACTSPRIIVWMGKSISQAKEYFWKTEHELIRKRYSYQPIQGINKLEKSYLIAAVESGVRMTRQEDNLLVRVTVPQLNDRIMDYRGDSGYFYEYDCGDIIELLSICNDKRCQTVAYIGNKEMFAPLLKKGIRGVDRIVPIGKTMDFDLIWDGYDMVSQMTRRVSII